MAGLGQIFFHLLVYPGLLSMIMLGILYTTGQGKSAAYRNGFARLALAWRSREGLLVLLSILLAGSAPALLEWPYSSIQADGTQWYWALLLLEMAWLLPAIPALMSNAAPLARAALREIQLGTAARMLLWFALGLALSINVAATPLLWPAYVLAILAALAVLPIALGSGPYAGETSITAGGIYHGWPKELQTMSATATELRRTAMLAVSLLALLPSALLPAWAELLLLLVGMALGGLLVQRLDQRGPRLTLPAALRRCWLRSLPFSTAAAVYLLVIGRP
jgi:hypothetical protein